MQAFLYGCTFCLHEDNENAHENVFSSKMLSKVETFEKAMNAMQMKCGVNTENVSSHIISVVVLREE